MHPQGLLQGSPGSWHFSLSGKEMSMLQTLRERERQNEQQGCSSEEKVLSSPLPKENEITVELASNISH